MSTADHPDGPHPRPPPTKDRKNQNSFLVLGIVFLVVGIGLTFGDSSAWIVFFILGVTFLGMSATPQAGRKDNPTPPRDT